MIPGVTFQPNASYPAGYQRQQDNTGAVQEAIKVLSLRLPTTVGAQAAAPQQLLQSSGSGGSRVDSVVNQILAKLFPGGGSPAQAMPSFGTAPPSSDNGPSIGGASSPYFASGYSSYESPSPNWLQRAPRVEFGNQQPQAPTDVPVREAPSIDRIPPKRSPLPDLGGWGGPQETEQPPTP
jgi:hypothetical protein